MRDFGCSSEDAGEYIGVNEIPVSEAIIFLSPAGDRIDRENNPLKVERTVTL